MASSSPAVAPEESAEDKKAALIAELEKRKARAAKFGLPVEEVEAKLKRAIKFGVEADANPSLKVLEGGLRDAKKKEGKKDAAKNTVAPGAVKAQEAKVAPIAKPVETEEEKAARIARQEADEAAKKRRAERFGIPIQSGPKEGAPKAVVDSAEEERKRKRMEKFGGAPSAEVSNCLSICESTLY